MNGLNCRMAKRLLSERRDVALASLQTISLDRHLEKCSACRSFADRLEHQASTLRSKSPVDTNALKTGALASRAVSQWAASDTGERSDPRRSKFILAAPISVIAVMAVLAFTLTTNHGRSIVSPKGIPSGLPAAETASIPHGRKPTMERSVERHREIASAEGGRGGRSLIARSRIQQAVVGTTGIERHGPVPVVNVAPAMPPAMLPAMPQDDLAYVNAAGGIESYIRRWGRLSTMQSDQLQAEIDKTVLIGDDFVTVPFPQVAAAGSGARAAASEAIHRYRQERAVVDPRLLRKVTLSEKAMPFSDLCAHLTAETGVSFTAGRTAADDKVTIFCKDRPLRDIMRAVTHLFNFSWERDGKEPDFRYVLFQPVRAQLAEEEMRNHDRNEALADLDRQMERFRSHLDLSPDQAKALAFGATGEDRAMYDALGGNGWGAAHLYFGLSSDQLASLRNGDSLTFKGVGSGSGQMPAEVGRGVLDALRDSVHFVPQPDGIGYQVLQDPKAKGMTAAVVPGITPCVQLSLHADELGQFSLEGDGGFFCTQSKNGAYGLLNGQVIARAISPSTSNPKNAEANDTQKTDPALKRSVNLPVSKEQIPNTANKPKRITSADILEAFHRASGRDVIGDYYTRLYEPGLLKPEPTPVSLFTLLCRVCDTARLRWAKDEDWLTFRSAGFFNDRPKEVPARLLERWAAARRENNGQLPINSLCEIALLTDTQLNAGAVAEGVRALYGLEEWGVLKPGGARPSWRLLAALPPEIRRMAFSRSGNGIRFEQIPPDRQEQFARAALGMNFTLTDAAEKMIGAAFQATYEPPVPAQEADPARGLPAVPAKEADFKFIYRYNYRKEGQHTVREIRPHGTGISDVLDRPGTAK